MKRLLQIAKIVDWPQGTIVPREPYRIIETVITCDGPRSRLTNHGFTSLSEAQIRLKELEE